MVMSPMKSLSVHPHGRGENTRVRYATMTADGTPPRAWGKRQVGEQRSQGRGTPPRAWGKRMGMLRGLPGIRYTPTGVGKTPSAFCWFITLSVHPHGRGENCTRRRRHRSATGTPPRAWGKRSHRLKYRRLRRYTPTGVGKTFDYLRWDHDSAVHPHGRGENASTPATSAAPPVHPHGRGENDRAVLAAHPAPRYTPTGVGKTMRRPPWLVLRPVHPHGRGENVHRNFLLWKFTVHPHGRGENAWLACKPSRPARYTPTGVGKTCVGDTDSMRGRYTPTGVGKTCCSTCTCSRRAVHPHGRGENIGSFVGRGGVRGTPPRAWGKLALGPEVPGALRYTPTGVGKTTASAGAAAAGTVHPHGRGENVEALFYDCFGGGTPPRAWGKLTRCVYIYFFFYGTPPRAWGKHFFPSRRTMNVGTPPRAWGKRLFSSVNVAMVRYTPTGVGKTVCPCG